MNKVFWISGIIFAGSFFSSCNEMEEQQKEAVETQTIVLEESCLYSYDADASSVNWIAFKTTSKVGVGGTFESVIVELPDTVYSPMEALEKVSFKVIASSVFTNNPERDATLREYFFGTLEDAGNIEGKVKMAEGDNNAGSGVVLIKMNNISRDIGFKYVVESDVITIIMNLDLDSFHGKEAIKTLNKECGELHAGEDGVSKLWPNIEIEVIAALKKQC
jgi:hypothetical protein